MRITIRVSRMVSTNLARVIMIGIFFGIILIDDELETEYRAVPWPSPNKSTKNDEIECDIISKKMDNLSECYIITCIKL
jgi:hypothetical protein